MTTQDLATRIREWLDEHDACVDSDCHAEHLDALRTVVDMCAGQPVMRSGYPWVIGMFARDIRTAIAGSLGILDSAIEADGRQSGVDTPGCDCTHDGMGRGWHLQGCAWLQSVDADPVKAAAGRPPAELNWRGIALRLFSAPKPDRSLLSTRERDALEAEVARVNERDWIDDDSKAERAADAADRGECA